MPKGHPSLYDLHRYCAYKDPVFIKKAEALKAEIVDRYGKPFFILIDKEVRHPVGEPDQETEELIFNVRSGEHRGGLHDEYCERIIQLAKEYCLHPDDIAFYLNPLYSGKLNMDDKVSVVMNSDGVSIKLQPHTTLKDIERAWPEVQAMRDLAYEDYKPTKQKAPQYPELIYAVFRARRKDLTFRQIYELYSKGQLPLYSGSAKQFDEETLERYYRKYRPDR